MLALFGPTGVGKTAVAIAVADRLRGRGEDPVAISADALQVYAGLEILTGVATAAERRRLEHRLVCFMPVSASFSVGEFMPRAHAEIDAAREAGRRAMVVGGTGLYLRAALCELDLRPAPPPALRKRLEREAEARGSVALHARLRERAPGAADSVEPHDRSRIIRALELAEMEIPDSDPLQRAGSQLWESETRHPTALVGLTMERERLYRRIDERVDAIVAAGAPDEVRRAEAAGASPTARKALGYEELLTGDVDALKRRTRQYAKRQLTWMRKLGGVQTVDVSARAPGDVAGEVVSLLDRR